MSFLESAEATFRFGIFNFSLTAPLTFDLCSHVLSSWWSGYILLPFSAVFPQSQRQSD